MQCALNVLRKKKELIVVVKGQDPCDAMSIPFLWKENLRNNLNWLSLHMEEVVYTTKIDFVAKSQEFLIKHGCKLQLDLFAEAK